MQGSGDQCFGVDLQPYNGHILNRNTHGPNMNNLISKTDVVDTFQRWLEIAKPFENTSMCNVIRIEFSSIEEFIIAKDNVLTICNSVIRRISRADKSDLMIMGLNNFASELYDATEECDEPLTSTNQALIVYVIEQLGKELSTQKTSTDHETDVLKIITNLGRFAANGAFGETIDRLFEFCLQINSVEQEQLLIESNALMII